MSEYPWGYSLLSFYEDEMSEEELKPCPFCGGNNTDEGLDLLETCNGEINCLLCGSLVPIELLLDITEWLLLCSLTNNSKVSWISTDRLKPLNH